MDIKEQMHAAFIRAMKRRNWPDEYLARYADDYAHREVQGHWVGFVEGWQARGAAHD